ncbi:MAG: Aminodeoxychorismate synthase component 1 [Bacteroidia bacterium]|nr:Aminodeoxychorismate synthase component 1 [Bacteroidia bacterium]
MRQKVQYISINRDKFLLSLFNWLQKADVFAIFNPYGSEVLNYGKFRPMFFIDKVSECNSNSINGFQSLSNYSDETDDFLIGYFAYDLKNQVEKLNSGNFDNIHVQELHFFQPKIVIEFPEENKIEISYLPEYNNESELFDLCQQIENYQLSEPVTNHLRVKYRISKDDYVDNVKKIKQHIQLGDIYELNYCIEFFAENVEINPVKIYEKLNNISNAPFSCLYKVNDNYLICASPERFLKKEGNKITAQPMKGTARRSSNSEEDEQIKVQLLGSEKERAENVMIVDLVRNDLSKTAEKNTVKVEELFGVYSFSQVHQMVSTISSQIREDVGIVEVIKSAFPMGSMTGAPKVKAMELIEKFETTKRGLFSGAVGYITPEKDFDFNVVIRSIQYNAKNKYLSFMVGSAITINSDPEKEYEECLLKARALIEALK